MPSRVHLHFELVDLLVVGDHRGAEVVVAVEEAVHGLVQAAVGERRHQQDILLQRIQFLVEAYVNMFSRLHAVRLAQPNLPVM